MHHRLRATSKRGGWGDARTSGGVAFVRRTLLVLSRSADVVDFEDHTDELCRQRDLLLLPDQSLQDMLLFHVCVEQAVGSLTSKVAGKTTTVCFRTS